MHVSEIEINGGILEDELSSMTHHFNSLTEMFDIQAVEIAKLRADIKTLNESNKALSRTICYVSEGKRFTMDSPNELVEIERVN